MNDSRPTPGRRQSLMAIAVVGALLAGGLWLARNLSAMRAAQDCAAAGLRQCGQSETAPAAH